MSPFKLTCFDLIRVDTNNGHFKNLKYDEFDNIFYVVHF